VKSFVRLLIGHLSSQSGPGEQPKWPRALLGIDPNRRLT
jgi:hypothetical protein